MKRIPPIYKGEILNLDKIQVYHEDTDPSSLIFGVKGIPSVISSGKHSFFIDPIDLNQSENSDDKFKLKKSTNIKLEIIDKIGTRIFYDFPSQPPNIITIDGSRVLQNENFISGYFGPDSNDSGLAVSFNIDSNIEDGTGKIIIVGELENVPKKWKGVYNVRWMRDITIQKSAVNKSRLYFYNQPTVSVDEFVTFYYSQSLSAPTTSSIVSGDYSLIDIKTPQKTNVDR